MVTSQEIMEKRFNKAKFFGYRPDEVDSFLDSAARSLQDAEARSRTLEHQIQEMNEKLRQYQEDEESLRSALVGAQKLGDSMVREARQKADEILQSANEQAEQILYAARRREENQQAGLEQIKQEVSDFKSRLIEIYRQHIELIRELPAPEPEEEELLRETDREEEVEESPENVEEKPALSEDPPHPMESETVSMPQTQSASEGESQSVSPGGFQISFDRFEDDFKGERRESAADAAQRIASRYEKTGDPYAGMKRDSSKFGPLKFGAGYEVTRDEHKKKR